MAGDGVDDGVELEDASGVEVERAAEEESVDTSGTPVCVEPPAAVVSCARTDAVGVGLLTTTEPEKGRSRLLVFCRFCSSLGDMLVREGICKRIDAIISEMPRRRRDQHERKPRRRRKMDCVGGQGLLSVP